MMTAPLKKTAGDDGTATATATEAFALTTVKAMGLLPFQKEVGGLAAGGFAGAVVNVLDIGMAKLPEFEREER